MKRRRPLLTVGVGGGEHGALGDVAAEHEGGGPGALPVGAVATLRLPHVHRPQPHRHHDPFLPRHRRARRRSSRVRLVPRLADPVEERNKQAVITRRSHAPQVHNDARSVCISGLGDCKVWSAERMIPVTEDGVRSVLGSRGLPPSPRVQSTCSGSSKRAPAQEAAGRATTGVGRAVGVGAASLPSARVQSEVARGQKTVGVEAARESAAPTAGRLRTASPWIVFYARARRGNETDARGQGGMPVQRQAKPIS
jgi:hypothetical protein